MSIPMQVTELHLKTIHMHEIKMNSVHAHVSKLLR